MLRRYFSTSLRLSENAGKSSLFGSSIEGIFTSAKNAAKTSNSIDEKPTTVNEQFIPSFDSRHDSQKITYDPFDFSIASQRFNSRVNAVQFANKMKSSSFNSKEINPTDFYVLPHLLNGYMNESGQILHRSVTGLSGRKQKQMSKAIRRAKSFGLLSSVAKDVSTFPKRGDNL